MRTTRFATRRDALTLAAALIGWAVLLAPFRTGAVAGPQVSTAIRDPAASVIATAIATVIATAATRSTRPPEVARRGSDVLLEDYPLGDIELAALRTGDRVAWPHPDGGRIELRVVRAESAHGRRHLVLAHDGLVSTFTEAGGLFLGTLATRRGVYALEGDAQSSRLTRHALLDQRMNVHALDYRPPPAR